jgi:7,8-dihydroneopterin aldolase/epimerase/oxygenase
LNESLDKNHLFLLFIQSINMLTVSLQGIKLHAPHGLYPQEHILGNEFEIDVDIFIPVSHSQPWPFVDYTLVYDMVSEVFSQQGQLLETFVQNIHSSLKQNVPEAEKIKVVVRKLHPPLPGDVRSAQVCYEG